MLISCISIFLIILLVLIFIFIVVTDNNDSSKTSLRLKWICQAQFAGFYTANAEEYYKEAGLNVEIFWKVRLKYQNLNVVLQI